MYNILDNIGLVQMSVQYSWQYMFSSNECTIFLTVYVQIKWVYNILDGICLVQWVYNILDNIGLLQMSVQYTWQYTWQYMFNSNECTIYLTIYI